MIEWLTQYVTDVPRWWVYGTAILAGMKLAELFMAVVLKSRTWDDEERD